MQNPVRTAVEWRHLAVFCLPTAAVSQEMPALERVCRYQLLERVCRYHLL